MSAKEERLEYRLAPAARARIIRAAALAGEKPTVFARDAALSRADQVLLEHDRTTAVPEEFFDELLAAFDDPPVVNARLAAAAKAMRKNVIRA